MSEVGLVMRRGRLGGFPGIYQDAEISSTNVNARLLYSSTFTTEPASYLMNVTWDSGRSILTDQWHSRKRNVFHGGRQWVVNLLILHSKHMATAARALSTFNATWSSWATLSSSAFRPVFSVSTRPTKSPEETRPRRNPTFFHSLMRSGISTMAFLLFSILSRQVSKPPPELPRHPPPADQRKDVLCNHVPLVLVTLDLLPNTRALDAQALSDPLLQPHV